MGVGFLWALMGRGVYMLAQWLILVLLARFGSVELVGSFGLALSVATPFFVLAFVCMPVLTASRYQDYPAGVFLSAAQIAMFPAMAGAFALAFFLGGEGEALLIFLGVALIKGLESYSEVLYGIFRRKGQLARMGQSQVLKGVAGGGLFASTVWLGGTPVVALFGFFAGALVVYVFFDRQCLRGMIGRVAGPWKESVSWYRRIVLSAFPLSVMALLTALASATPRYFIEAWEGREALGYFVVVSYFLMAMTTFGFVFSQAANPRLASAWRSDTRQFWPLLIRYSVLIVLACATAWGMIFFVGEQLLVIVFGEEYGQSSTLLLLLLLSAVPLTLRDLLSTALVVIGEVRIQARMSIVALFVMLVGCVLLVPSYGVWGGGLAIVLSSLTSLLYVAYRCFSSYRVAEAAGFVASARP